MYDKTLIRLLAVESELSITACNACHRKGLPILPLRRALVPKSAQGWTSRPDPELPDVQLGLRTLRNGYLYVLLDNSVWQAYQVTPDGYLRQFSPWAPPLSNDMSLAQACIHADHDMPASFLTIDTLRYRHAAIAFASDPWPARVLDAYKAGQGAGRLLTLDLSAARVDPASLGLAMTAEDPKTADEVYEYQAFVPGFNSVHGFNTRADRRLPFRNYIRSAIATHDLEHGVLGLVLDDSVGLVQEYNGLRASWAFARQVWMEEPDRAYRQQTSQILLAIRALNRQVAETKVPTEPPRMPENLPITGDWQQVRQSRVERLAHESEERLEQRYDEPRRAAFQQDYEQQLSTYQAHIDHYAALYAQAFKTEAFRLIEQHDYTPYDQASVSAYCNTLSLCLRGGISEAPGDDSGPTAQLWQTLLDDPASPVYKALLRNDQNWLSLLTPHFNPDGRVDWRDSNRLYTLITQTATSQEGQKLYRAHLQEAVAQLLAALNSSSLRLKDLIHPGVQSAVSRLNTLSQFVYNRVHLIELQVDMKLREYYALQSEHIRSLQNSLASDGKSAAPPKVRPLIMGGLLNLSVLDPKIADLSIKTTVWVEGTLDDLKTLLDRDAGPTSQLGTVHDQRIATVTVGVGTLDPLIGKTWKEFKVSSHLAQSWVRNGFAGLKGVAKSAPLLIGIGSLYLLNDAMGKNLKAAEEAIGDKSLEARLALQGSTLAVLGAGIEVAGAALKGASTGMQANGLRSASGQVLVKHSVAAGEIFLRAGAIIVALTSLYDSAQAGFAAKRNRIKGDVSASKAYLGAAIVFGVGAFAGVVVVLTGAISLMSILGVALITGISGYGISKWAAILESAPFEFWARRSFFGVANEVPIVHWKNYEQAFIAFSELNAILVGLQVDMHFETRLEFSSASDLNCAERISDKLINRKRHLNYQIVFPNYDESRAAYRLSIIVHRWQHKNEMQYKNGEMVFQQEFHPPLPLDFMNDHMESRTAEDEFSQPDIFVEATMPVEEIKSIDMASGGVLKALDLRGKVEVGRDTGRCSVKSVSLVVTYWPNRANIEGYAQVRLEKN
jgi:hypothetical protein